MDKRVLRTKKGKPRNSRPYDRPNQSIFGKVASKVKGLLNPSWLFNVSQWISAPGEDDEEPGCSTDFLEDEPQREDMFQPQPSSHGSKRPRLRLEEDSPNILSAGTQTWLDASASHSLFESTPRIPPVVNQVPLIENKESSITMNGDDHSENSEGSASTSGCSSLVSSHKDRSSSCLPNASLRLGKSPKGDFTGNLNTSRSLWSSGLCPSAKFSRRPPSVNSSNQPSFNISSFVGPSKLNSAAERKVSSPFYQGNTTFGGASSSRRMPLSVAPYQVDKPLRNQVKVRQNNTQDSLEGMSSAAKRILLTLEKMSSPVTDAKKIPVTNKSPVDLSLYLTPPKHRRNSQFTPSIPTKGPPIADLSTVSRLATLRNIGLKKFTNSPMEVPVVTIKEKESEVSDPVLCRESSSNIVVQKTGGGKMRNKLNQQHRSTKDSINTELLEEMALPNIPLPISTLPTISFKTPATISEPDVTQSGKGFVFSSPIEHVIPNSSLPAVPQTNQTRGSKPDTSVTQVEKTFRFSSPIELELPAAKLQSTESVNSNSSVSSTPSTWECKECWVRNPVKESRCMACETPKPCKVPSISTSAFSGFSMPVSSKEPSKSSDTYNGEKSGKDSSLNKTTTGNGFGTILPFQFSSQSTSVCQFGGKTVQQKTSESTSSTEKVVSSTANSTCTTIPAFNFSSTTTRTFALNSNSKTSGTVTASEQIQQSGVKCEVTKSVTSVAPYSSAETATTISAVGTLSAATTASGFSFTPSETTTTLASSSLGIFNSVASSNTSQIPNFTGAPFGGVSMPDSSNDPTKSSGTDAQKSSKETSLLQNITGDSVGTVSPVQSKQSTSLFSEPIPDAPVFKFGSKIDPPKTVTEDVTSTKRVSSTANASSAANPTFNISSPHSSTFSLISNSKSSETQSGYDQPQFKQSDAKTQKAKTVEASASLCTAATTNTFSFGSKPAAVSTTSGFSFFAPSGITTTAVATGNSTVFKFGSSSNSPQMPKFVASNTSTPAFAGFSMPGSSQEEPAKSTDNPIQQKSSKDSSLPKNITVDGVKTILPFQIVSQPTSMFSTAAPGFKLGDKINPPKTTAETTSLSESVFSSVTNATCSSTGTFNFSNTPSSTFALISNSKSNEAPSASGQLQFQQSGMKAEETKTITSATPFCTAPTTNTFTFGTKSAVSTTSSFSFFAPSSTTTTTVSTVSNPSAFTFGASSNTPQMPKFTGFTFKGPGEEKTAAMPSNSVSFSTPAVNTTTPSVFKFGTSVPTSSGAFVFGAPKSEPQNVASTPFAFGSGAASTASPSTFSGFPTNQTAAPAFQFGSQPCGNSVGAPAFGATTSNFSFGNKNEVTNQAPGTVSQQAPPPPFGVTPVQPVFGSSTGPAFGMTEDRQKSTSGGFNFMAPASNTGVFQFGTEKQDMSKSGFPFGTLAQTQAPHPFPVLFNMNTPPNFNFGAASAPAGPFQFAASSENSGAQASAPRKYRKAVRRVLRKAD